MAESEWSRIFQNKAKNLKQGDSWRLEFDENLVPKRLNPGWKMCIGSTSARFKCTMCGRGWPSISVKVVFHMRLAYGQGIVKVKPLGQNCKMCHGAPVETPHIDSENINILLSNLMEKIRIKCYHEAISRRNRPFKRFDVNSPHEPVHCEACRHRICNRN